MSNIARFALLPIAIAQFAAPALPALGFGETIGARATGDGIPPELPLGAFFGIIWTVIFSAYLIVALIAILKPRHLTDHIAPPLALAGIGNVVWMISSQTIGLVWLDLLLLLPILFAIWEAAIRLDRVGGFDGTGRRLLLCVLVGLLSGWISAAVSISVPDTARYFFGRGATDNVWQSLWMALGTASVLAFLFARFVSRSLWFFVALGWGLLGITLNNWTRTDLHGLAIATAIIGVLIISYRWRKGAYGSTLWTG